MSMAKTTNDTRVIQASSLYDSQMELPGWLCGWVRWDSALATNDLIFTTFGGGAWFSLYLFNATTLYGRYPIGGVGTNRAHVHTIVSGVWSWVHGGVDGSGNWVLGNDTIESTGVGGAPGPVGVLSRPNLLNYTGGYHLIGTLFDFRYYNRVPSLAERQTIYRARGKDGITNGLVCRLDLLRQPGTTTATVLPIDRANPARTWVSAGTGAEYAWREYGPLRRK